MKIEFHKSYIEVFREKGDKGFYGVMNAAGESGLFHAIKKHLNAKGFDLIKKRMHKDGHLVDEMQQYLRSRVIKENLRNIYIYNNRWAIEGAEEDYNTTGITELRIEYF